MSNDNFSHYARYYDLLYRDKDYADEARFVDSLLRPDGAHPRTLLDVGCGTGAHARAFATLGWKVTGVDLSADMIALARTKTAAPAEIEYATGAAAEFSLGRTFAAAVSLFHVMSYQAAPGEAERALANVRRHLDVGGRFVFDFWHGPGVLADPPVVRVRRVSDGRIRAVRIAEPRHQPEEHRIDVAYEVFIEDTVAGGIVTVKEVHRLRYFFLPELETTLARAGFALEHTYAGLSGQPLDARAWYGLVVARAK
jgi:SAM-dependent methyltransferase